MLEIRDLHVRFNNRDRDAVGGISFTIRDGEILGLVGMVQANKHKDTHNTNPGRICSIIGFILSLINHILGIVLLFVL